MVGIGALQIFMVDAVEIIIGRPILMVGPGDFRRDEVQARPWQFGEPLISRQRRNPRELAEIFGQGVEIVVAIKNKILAGFQIDPHGIL